MTRVPRRVVVGSLLGTLIYWSGATFLHAAICAGAYPCRAASFAFVALVSTQAPAATDQQVYESFRAWMSQQLSVTVGRTDQATRSADLLTRYREVLAGEGLPASEIDRRLRVIQEQGRKLEVEIWNRVLTAEKPAFNVQPNAFLVQVAKTRKPGTALDVGMGQGRNAVYLAQQGWTVTGFDPAERAVEAARETATQLGVQLTAIVAADDTFDWGRERWDLVLLSYVGLRPMVPRVLESLRPGGLVVVEAFERDATKNASIGPGVVFDANELLTIFKELRILHYEDAEADADFGKSQAGFGKERTRVVRLAAEKPR